MEPTQDNPISFEENLKRYAKLRTISVAFPSSIFDNTPTPQLEAHLVGQIARAATVFNVGEIIIFPEDDTPESLSKLDRLIKLFEYAECPQYLRKRLFSLDPSLKYAGLIHPLESQHHLRTSQIECPYREGVTTKYSSIEKNGSWQEFTEVEIGLNQPVFVPGHLELHTRVTVQFDPSDLKKMQSMLGQSHKIQAASVPPSDPIEKLNLYWGYYVRKASGLSDVLNNNLFRPDKKKFYDLVIGTSERGTHVDGISFQKSSKIQDDSSAKKKKNEYRHILVVFGGVKGLEYSLSCDKTLKDCTDVSSLFDYYVNTCPNQGSTTIRTEEAILITMSALRPKLSL